MEGPVEHQDEVPPGDAQSGPVGGGAVAGGDAAIVKELHRGGRPAVAGHIGEVGGAGGGSDGDVYLAGKGAAVAVGAGISNGGGAGIARLGHKGDAGDGGAARGGKGDEGGDLSAVLAGIDIAVVELSGVVDGGVEPHRDQSAGPAGGAGADKVIALEGHGGAVGGVVDQCGLLRGGAGDNNSAGDAVAVGAPAGEGNLHGTGEAGGGDEGEVVHLGSGGAIVGGRAARSLLPALAPLIVEDALGGAGGSKADIVQVVVGEILAVVVEITGLEGHGGT